MRKLLFIAAVALLGTLGLAGCQNSGKSQSASSAPAKVSRPANPNDVKDWGLYLQQIVEANMGNIQNPPYLYFVPGAADPASNATVGRVQEQVNNMVIGTVLPGYMVAVGGPNSATTAQVLEAAFKQAAPGSFKGVTVLFIGDAADRTAVAQALTASGATFKFAQM